MDHGELFVIMAGILRDARVVCRMLGFKGALDATDFCKVLDRDLGIYFSILSPVMEQREILRTVQNLGLGVNYCGHEDDGGAICYSGGKCLYFQQNRLYDEPLFMIKSGTIVEFLIFQGKIVVRLFKGGSKSCQLRAFDE